jgi:predicted nuclease of restriction endonuclease-like (RecB) superfamily
LDKVSDPEQRIWYIKKTIENGWSRELFAKVGDGAEIGGGVSWW